jgi:hypothetical protein
MATIERRFMATGTVACVILLAACGGERLECKDTPHKATVRFELKSKRAVGKDNPEIEAAKALAQGKWEEEVKEKFGADWASWTNARSRDHTCGAPSGETTWTCEAAAPPCKRK